MGKTPTKVPTDSTPGTPDNDEWERLAMAEGKASIKSRKTVPPEGTPDWDAYPGADAAYYEVLVQATPEAYVQARIYERALWLSDRQQYGRWYSALEELDKRGDKGPLLSLLRTQDIRLPETVRNTVRESLACMLDRYQFEMRDERVEGDKIDNILRALLTEGPFSTTERTSFTNLLERYDLKRKPGNQATPLYERTPSEWERQLPCEHVECLVNKGTPRDEAIAAVFNERRIERLIDQHRLHSDLMGSSGWKRRLAKLRKRIRP